MKVSVVVAVVASLCLLLLATQGVNTSSTGSSTLSTQGTGSTTSGTGSTTSVSTIKPAITTPGGGGSSSVTSSFVVTAVLSVGALVAMKRFL